MGFEIELCLLLSGNLHAGCVVGGIKISTTAHDLTPVFVPLSKLGQVVIVEEIVLQ